MPHFSPFTLTCRGRKTTFHHPAVMGILNVTPDSFYDGGRYTTPDAILSQARQLIADGADIIDIGAVSSRPGAQLLSPDEEAARLVPVVELLRNELPPDTILSVDTCYSLPAAKAVEAGESFNNSWAKPCTLLLVASLCRRTASDDTVEVAVDGYFVFVLAQQLAHGVADMDIDRENDIAV